MPKEIEKKCKIHKISLFVLEKRGYYRCKKCRIDKVIKYRIFKKKKLVELKGGKCYNCGYNKCLKALQFHHLNPKEKLFQISRYDGSFKKILNESNKCILLCANCHAETEESIFLNRKAG